MISVFSCEEYPFVTNCADCLENEPASTNLLMKIDVGQMSASARNVTLKLYEGNLEDSVLINEYIISSDKFEVVVNLNRKYTATATYHDNEGNTYIAVDSATPKVRYEKNMCENPCYWIYDKVLNLRLKYY